MISLPNASSPGGMYALKPRFRQRLDGLASACARRRVHPDWLTYAAVGCAALVGGAILASPRQPRMLLLVGPLVALRLTLNALDGLVAERTGLARPWGKVLNEGCDRVSDVLCLLPLALLPGGSLGWSLATLGAALATAYTRTLAEAAGAGPQYSGPMGKADRMLWLSLACAAAAVTGQWWPLQVLPLVLLGGGLLTLVQRGGRAHAAL